MSLTERTEIAARTNKEVKMSPWVAGAIGGLSGGVVMGIMAAMMLPAVMNEYIPGLIGLEGPVAGWLVHLVVATTFGVGYAALATQTSFVDRSPNVAWDVGLGLAYGAALWLVTMSLAMPLWLGALGGTALPFPWFDPMTLVGHLAYGAVVGAVFPYVEFE